MVSLMYSYSITATLSQNATPAWWPKALRKMYGLRAAHALSIGPNGWVPAIMAASLRQQLAMHVSMPATFHIRPTNLRQAKALVNQIPISAKALFSFHQNPTTKDPTAAMFVKNQFIVDQRPMLIGQPIALKQLNAQYDENMAAKVLEAGGCQLGIAVQIKATGAIAGTIWKPNTAPDMLVTYPTTAMRWARCISLVKFPTDETLLGTLNLAEERATGTWHVTTPRLMYDESNFYEEGADMDLPTTKHVLPTRLQAKQTDRQPSRPPSEHEDIMHEKDSEQVASAPPPGILPAVLTHIGQDDRVIAAMLEHHLTGTRPTIIRQLDQLSDWRIPGEIADDDEGLRWISTQLPRTYTTTHHYKPQNEITAITRNIDEQIRLNSMRRVAAALTRASDRPRTETSDPQASKPEAKSLPAGDPGPHPSLDWAEEVERAKKEEGLRLKHPDAVLPESGASNSQGQQSTSPAKHLEAEDTSSTAVPADHASAMPTLSVMTSL
jgi:hypothetical protein